MGLPQHTRKLTPAEYLEIERAATYRSECFDGEMFAMAGGSARHSLIKVNLCGEIRARLKGAPCTAYDSDLRILVFATGLYTYPDASVICGRLEFEDERRDSVLNPTLLVEVLSDSTEAYDRGKKFSHYRQIPALREYLLVSQEEPKIERFLRNDDGTWTLTEVSGPDAILPLPSLGVEISLREVYDKVEFTAPAEQGPSP
ncbi:MAG: Uma2 family endonuclease [Planctomycetota bacterium]|nr:Uma2 family endonuclease [Planctomycetota bacterium]